MIRFNKDTVGLWFVEMPDSDWLASIWMEEEKAVLTYRFRHYEDDKVWDSKDRKNWYELKTDDVHKLIETTRVLAKGMSAAAGTKLYEIMASDFTDIDAFMEEFQKAPFVSMQRETVQ